VPYSKSIATSEPALSLDTPTRFYTAFAALDHQMMTDVLVALADGAP
jgi:hypothetical protein